MVGVTYSKLFLAVGLALFTLSGWGRMYTFDSSMIENNGYDNIDVSLFNQGLQLPGEYFVNIFVNGNRVGSEKLNFRLEKHNGKDALTPCLSSEQLTKFGVDVDKYSGLFKYAPEQCADLWAIPNADVQFDFNQQKLSIIVPPQALLPKVKGIAPMQLWDDGIPAIFMNYQTNTQQIEYQGAYKSRSESYYAQLQPGLNIGAWRLRSSASWQKNQGWQRSYIYAERGLNEIKSRFTLGESYSDGSIFDSIPFTGGKLASDKSMVPYDQWSFAPTVRGVARTQARVEIQQNGYTVSNELVPSGPFEITNLPQGGRSGDLKVIIHESDGTQQVFNVPYDAPAVALRQGYFEYAVMGGKYRPANDAVHTTTIGALEMKYGLPWNLTLYGGFQGANNYQAAALGIGSLLGDFGAISADIIQSNSKKEKRSRESGQRWRIRYNKSLNNGMSVNIASEEYATKGFNTLPDTLNTYCNSDHKSNCNFDLQKPKNKINLSVSQTTDSWGTFIFTGYRQNYWNNTSSTTSFSAGYSKTFVNGMSLNINLSKTQNIDRSGKKTNDRLTSIWLSVPLGRWLSNSSIYGNYQMTSDSQGDAIHELGVYGDAFDRQLHWDIRERYKKNANKNISSDLSLNYHGTYGELRGNYSYDKKRRQLGIGANGKVLVTQHGVTAGQNTGDTIALIQAPGVDGASVGYWPGVKTDFRGYTSYGFLTPYQENNVDINPVTLPKNAEIPQTSTRVVPTKGAVVLAKFDTRIGGRLLLKLKRSDNKPVPFGSIASVVGQSSGSGIVGDNSQVYLTGLPKEARVKVQWGKSKNQSCNAKILLPEKSNSVGIYNLTAICTIN